MELKNKVAVVTGAKQGIGRGIVLALARAGADVVVSDLDMAGCQETAAAAEKLGVRARAVVCDVSQKEAADKLIAETVAALGRVDILVNNAGIFPFVAFDKMTEADWDKVMAVNMKGVFLCTQAALKEMSAGAKIINISSIASQVGFEGLVHYCASKGGVNAFTRALALELAPRKINVNAVAPGAIETPGATTGMSEDVKAGTIASIPWKEMGKPDDIAHAVVFLASAQANYITGQVLTVDGGWTLR